jgi:DNA-binding beta-propeller fold protein YncE
MITRYYRWCSPILFIAILLLAFSHTAYADGGAPNLAYVVGSASGVDVIDVAQQKVTSNFNISGAPHSALLSPDARFLYVTQPASGQVSVLAAKTAQQICSASVSGQPSVMALDPSTAHIYVGGNGASVVSEIDPSTCQIVRTFQTNGPVYGLYVAAVATAQANSTGNQLWVAAGDALEVFDTTKASQITSIPITGGPDHVTIPPGATVYTTTRSGSVDAVDLSSHKITTLVSGGQYGPMDFDETTGEVYVPDMTNNQLVVLAPVNAGFAPPHEPSRTIKLGVQPQSVAITSDGQLGFVALSGGNVAMLDIPGRNLVSTIYVGGSPQFVITGLYPPVIGTTPQQATIWSAALNIAAYVLIVLLLIVPILLYRYYSRKKTTSLEENPEDVPTDVK